ncbi:DUF421 domain-containing protein [Caloranaerobacter ferrireducens]|uniref:DUF421 domain-containing protein n=1 Tax=Caloranaerobacter ferrireducens TaxID=1323370 RepID=UPI00084D2D11|nr:YetF domain-containing protein [Caloranaerobacter ferrireducens]
MQSSIFGYFIYMLRTTLGYFLALIMVRFMGKRSIGELSAFDIVLMTGVGHIMSSVALDKELPLMEGILILSTIAVLEIALAFIAIKNRKIANIVNGKPTYLIKDGKLLKENMKKEKFNIYDLRQELRKKGIADENDVEKAIIEACGKFSVIKKYAEEPLRRKDLGIFKDGDSPQYLEQKFSELKSELNRLNMSLDNIIIEINKLKNKE